MLQIENTLNPYYDPDENAYRIKISILGNGRVGKTSLCSSLETGIIPQTYDMTVGVDIATTQFFIDAQTKVRLILWDLAGQQHFDSVRPAFYKGAKVAIIVFDLQNRGTFYDVPAWIRELNINAPGVPFILVGNKKDLKNREVSTEEALALAKKYNAMYFETSAKTGENVQNVFRYAAVIALQGTTVAF